MIVVQFNKQLGTLLNNSPQTKKESIYPFVSLILPICGVYTERNAELSDISHPLNHGRHTAICFQILVEYKKSNFLC